jgi:hypothetical protein
MKRAAWLLFILVAISCPALWAGNAVVVQSKSVTPSANSVTVGIYIENDVALGGVALPIQIREVNPGSFISGALSVEASNRLISHLTGYVVQSFLPEEDNDKYWLCGGRGFNTRGDPDFVSPDAFLYAAVRGDEDSYLPVGDDGAPPNGTPSLRVTFGVTSAIGTFEIDTACVTPYNNLAFMDCEISPTMINPTFTKGVIEIGGPFFEGDSISGHVTSDLVINHDVIVTGDLTIDSGVTLTVVRGTHLSASAYEDDQSGGVDNQSVEIIVYGTLAIDETSGERPVFNGTSETLAAWHGIRVMHGGHFSTGIGAVVDWAEVGVDIDRPAPADTLSGLLLRYCHLYGVRDASASVALMNDTAVSSETGIFVDSAGPRITSCFLDSCSTGISCYFATSNIRNTAIDGPGAYGVYIEDASFEMEGRHTEDRVRAASDVPIAASNVSMVGDTISGYFSMAQLYMAWESGTCAVDSCGFIHPGGSSRSPYGLMATSGDELTMHRSLVTGYSTYGVYSDHAHVHLGTSSVAGNNAIWTDTTGCGQCLLKRVYHSSFGADTLKAENNWWGTSSPSSSWFSAKVDWNPYLTSPPSWKIVALQDEPEQAAVPSQYSLGQNYPNPFNAGTQVEFTLASAQRVEIKVYNVLGQVVRTLANQEFQAGTHRVIWDGTMEGGNHAASGVYLYRLVAGRFGETKKMVLLK